MTICRYGSRDYLRRTGAVRGQGLSSSRVRQAHQLVGAVLKFAVRAKHLPANPADGVGAAEAAGIRAALSDP